MATPKEPSLWLPMQDRQQLAMLGKLGEEANELSKAIFRAIIQGLDEKDPETGKVNREAIREEMADVQGLLWLVNNRVATYDELRADAKYQMKKKWIEMIEAWERENFPKDWS